MKETNLRIGTVAGFRFSCFQSVSGCFLMRF